METPIPGRSRKAEAGLDSWAESESTGGLHRVLNPGRWRNFLSESLRKKKYHLIGLDHAARLIIKYLFF